MFDEPPVLPELPPPVPPPAPTAPRWLLLAMAAAGLAVLVLAIVAAPIIYPNGPTARQVGYVLGAFLVWPAIVLGLFSIGKRFRNPRSRAHILLWTWLFCIVSAIGSIHQAQHRPPDRFPPGSPFSPTPKLKPTIGPLRRESDPLLVQHRPPPLPEMPPGVDWAAGSDQRLIFLVESGELNTYHTFVAGYQAACARRPLDERLAEERVRFIQHFLDREDDPIESAQEDYATALAELKAHFPRSPVVVLHELGNSYSPDFKLKAELHRPDIYDWAAADRAEYFLRVAQGANHRGDVADQLANSRKSFDEKPGASAGLLEAEALIGQKRNAEALALLRNPVFASAASGQKRQVMNLRFEAGDSSGAMQVYAELKATPYLVRDPSTVSHLVWYGPAKAALAAYRQLQADGRNKGAIFRRRFKLLLRFPTLPWNWADVGDASLLLLIFAAVAAAPLLLLIPVHYWSLLRARRAKPPGWPAARWGLRDSAIGGAVICLGSYLPIWYWARPDFISGAGSASSSGAMDDIPLVRDQTVMWIAMVVTVAYFLWRRRAWRALGPGEWTWGRAIGRGLLLAFILRISLGIFALVYPQAIEGAAVSLSAMQTKFITELAAAWGPCAAIAVIGLLVPVLEEVLFRGVLLQALGSHIPFAAANVIQAALFATAHASLLLAPFFVAFGLINGMLAKRSKGLFPCVVVHATNNLVVVVVLLIRAHIRQ